MKRAVLGVLIGYLVWSVVWLAGNAVFFGAAAGVVESGEPYTAAGPLTGAIVLSLICSVAAGLTAAIIARGRALTAALIMAVLLLVTGILVQVRVWTLMPVWYHLTFLVLIVPGCVLGGMIARRPPDRVAPGRSGARTEVD